MRPTQWARQRDGACLPLVPFASAIEATFRSGNPEGPCAVVDRTATAPFPPLPSPTLPSPLSGEGQGVGLLPSFADGHLQFLELARPNDSNGLRRADFGLPQPGVQVLEAARRGAVEGDQRIALHQTGLVRRALRLDRDDQQPAILLCLRLHGLGKRDFLRPDAKVRAPDPSVGFEAGHYAFRHVHGDRPPRTTAEDPAIHADDATIDVDQRTTAEPGIERRVGLDQVLDLASPPAAPR